MGWTTEEMPDCSGKTIVVTGANSGLGLAATEAFARKGAHVVMASRSVDRGESAAAEIRTELPEASLSVVELDLADLDSIRAFADDLSVDSIDVLCNNAGVMALPRGETEDGFERQFGINHLGHFALTGMVLDRLRAAETPRVVTQSSAFHEYGEISFEDLHGETDYGKWDAYAQSKLANLLFAYELDRRTDLKSVGCHPGYADTNLQLRGPEMENSRLKRAAMVLANRLLAQPADRGALPMLYAATATDVAGGDYVGPGGLFGARGSPERQRSSKRSYDADLAARLWSVSEELTGVRYGE